MKFEEPSEASVLGYRDVCGDGGEAVCIYLLGDPKGPIAACGGGEGVLTTGGAVDVGVGEVTREGTGWSEVDDGIWVRE